MSSEARSGPFGCVVLCWHNNEKDRDEIVCGEVGDGNDGKLKPHTWYRVNEKKEIVQVEKE